ncbi:hypothetical protein AV530_017590 [Patagioenas fasciata monilis]|uniref:Uncharacterized protein n=1 Tax=Patagioenas fasciata monilis TaxID=372326 RepID=A0A1V4J8N9_PATFA|nr:hypothetical protein AV530_017590 [Patagioenas fasciata monilis]
MPFDYLMGKVCPFPKRDRALTFHFERDLEEERRALKEDQKICRTRAQKYSIETNRRRRAFEEKRKREEEKEQRFRERVLQKRKIKLQEATDRFQRAHLPFSQHKQIVQTKAAFQLEEALVRIKGSVLTPGLYLPSRNKTNFRTTDDTSSSSASRNGSCHQKQISAMVGWDKAIQESGRTNMDSNQLLFQKNLKEMQLLLEKQHLSNLENFHQEVKKKDDSDSLSSLDSLEAGEQNGNYTTPSESSLATQCDCALYNPERSQTRNNSLLCTAQSTSKNVHLNNCLRNADSQNNHNLPIHDLLAKYNVLTPAEHVHNSEEESSASHKSGKIPAEFFTKQESSINNAFHFLQKINEERSQSFSGTLSTPATGHPVFNPSKAWVSPDFVPGERVQDLMQDQSFKMTPQKRTISVQTPSQPIATSIVLFPNQGCSTDIPHAADSLPNDKNTSTELLKNTSGKKTEMKEENIKCVDDINPGTSLFQDILNASVLRDFKQQNNREEEKGNMVETMSLVSDTELNSSTPAQYKTLKNNILERKRARLFTSILKKETKYEPSHFKAVVMNHGIGSGTRPVSSIRDSLELAKIKKKRAENEKYNRKLRWCDQINQASACQDHPVTCAERRPVKAENGLRLHHIPAAGKTSTSWQGAHAARAPRGSATGVVPVTRQKQVFDGVENEHVSEHRRQIVASKRWKPSNHTQNLLCTVQLNPVQSAFDPVQNMKNTFQSDEASSIFKRHDLFSFEVPPAISWVSESTVPVLRAGEAVRTGAAAAEIPAARGGERQPARPPLPSPAPCPDIRALSIQEEKIIQSLDRLNQRLQNVEEAITRNPSASNVLENITPLSIQQCISPSLVNTIPSQQHQNALASNRLQLYRRY